MAAVAAVAVSAYSAYEGSRQSKRAASKQEDAATAAASQQQSQFESSQEQQAPYQAAGLRALGQQEALIGLGGESQQQAALEGLARSPGQQFLRDQQERALVRNASAIGGLGGGNVRTALQEQAFGRAQTDIANQFNRLGSISGAGQVATQNVGQLGALASGNIAQLGMQAGAARASGILGQQQAQQQGLSDIVGIATQSGAFNQNQQQPVTQQTTTQQPAQTNTYSVSGGAQLNPSPY